MRAGPYRVWVAVHSSWLLGAAIAIHVLMTTLAEWMEWSGARESSWWIWLFPASVPWILLILNCRGLVSRAPMAVLLIPIAWAAFVRLTIRSERYGLPSGFSRCSEELGRGEIVASFGYPLVRAISPLAA